MLAVVSAHGTQGLRRAWRVRCELSAPWASERAALRLRRVRCAVDRYRATARHPPPVPPPRGGDIVNTARDSFHPRWQPTSAFALKTLKVGIAVIPSSDPIPRTSSVLNLANTHDLAEERGEAGVLGGASEAPGLHCGTRAVGDPPPRSPPYCRAQARGRLEPQLALRARLRG